MDSTSNRIQIFSELVGLQAWHMPLTAKRTAVGLHADVTFSMARLGAEEACPVRFRVKLKRAVLSVEVPETEPLLIDPASVAREQDGSTSATRKTKRTTRTKAGLGGGVAVGVDPAHVSGSLALNANGSKDFEAVDEVQSTTKIASIVVRHSADGRGVQHWTFEPGIGAYLEGKPWSAADHPLMKVKDTRSLEFQKIEPSIRFTLTCLREDLHIYDIEYKEAGRLSRVRRFSGGKMIAAEAFIRTRIEQVGLVAPDMREGFAQITLARTTSGEGGW